MCTLFFLTKGKFGELKFEIRVFLKEVVVSCFNKSINKYT